MLFILQKVLSHKYCLVWTKLIKTCFRVVENPLQHILYIILSMYTILVLPTHLDFK